MAKVLLEVVSAIKTFDINYNDDGDYKGKAAVPYHNIKVTGKKNISSDSSLHVHNYPVHNIGT